MYLNLCWVAPNRHLDKDQKKYPKNYDIFHNEKDTFLIILRHTHLLIFFWVVVV